jgi:UDP-N-acetylmuramoylalanine--D-glutamate ligase
MLLSFHNNESGRNNPPAPAFKEDTILLLGGMDRGHSFDDLSDDLNHVKAIVCYGETKNRIKEFFDKLNISCNIVDNLEEAIEHAYSISKNGDVILLSPACASWDQFDSFEKRGELFKKVVNNIK